MVKLEYVPVGKEKMQEWYGHPPVNIVNGKLAPDLEWWKKFMVRVTLPFRLELDYAPKTYMVRPYVNKHIGPALVDAFEEILDFYGVEEIEYFHLNLSSGIYKRKFQRGANDTLSLHSYGAAIDYLPNFGKWGEKSRIPHVVHVALEERGFVNYPHTDGFHWQGARGV